MTQTTNASRANFQRHDKLTFPEFHHFLLSRTCKILAKARTEKTTPSPINHSRFSSCRYKLARASRAEAHRAGEATPNWHLCNNWVIPSDTLIFAPNVYKFSRWRKEKKTSSARKKDSHSQRYEKTEQHHHGTQNRHSTAQPRKKAEYWALRFGSTKRRRKFLLDGIMFGTFSFPYICEERWRKRVRAYERVRERASERKSRKQHHPVVVVSSPRDAVLFSLTPTPPFLCWLEFCLLLASQWGKIINKSVPHERKNVSNSTTHRENVSSCLHRGPRSDFRC